MVSGALSVGGCIRPAVTESVLTNVSPEVVEKVTGHAEGATSDHVQITDRMPDYLL